MTPSNRYAELVERHRADVDEAMSAYERGNADEAQTIETLTEAFDALATALTELAEENSRLTAAASALVAKLDECDPHLSSVFSFAFAHGIEYRGPQYGDALSELRAILPASPDPVEGVE